MFLKKIVSYGFKSFADKVTLTLDKKNITGVVGPNGSGKSNVIDAVRWVMGEQNAKMLRGEKATDIIFSGSEKRKPLGMAEVTLVFDNSEPSNFCPPEYRHEEEIALSRRLYIDGQREYFINRKPCRLKDIVSFFAATGLGGRSYSMIQQGQVDRILQAKPEQIREILEEAAGVLIFKQRKNETAKKLEKTTINLSRIEDLVTEVDRQMASLKEQVEKAELWQTNTQKLRELEINLFAHNYTHFDREEANIKSGIENHSLKDYACSSEITNLEKKLLQLKELIAEADPELSAINEEITVLREQIAACEASILSHKELSDNGGEQLQALEEDLKEDISSLQNLNEQSKEASERLKKAEQDLAQTDDILEHLSQQMEMIEEEELVYQSKLQELSEELQSLDKYLEKNKIKRSSIEKDYSQASRKMTSHSEKFIRLEEELSQAQILTEGLAIKLKNARYGLDNELTEKNRLENSIHKNQERLKEEYKKIETLQEKYLEKKSSLQSLYEIEKNSTSAISTIHKLRNEHENDLFPLLTDFISLPETYSIPAEIAQAFEKWTERLLIFDQTHLTKILDVLQGKQLGPLHASQMDLLGEAPSPQWLKEWNLSPITPIIDIKDQKIRPLLNRVFFSESHECTQLNMKNFLEEIPKNVIIFLKNGIRLDSQGELLLGQSEAKSLLSRKKDIEVLEKSIEQLETNINKRKSNIENFNRTIDLEATEKNNIEKKIVDKNQDILEFMTELKTAENKILFQKDIVSEVKEEYKALEEVCDQYGTEIDDLNSNDKSLQSEKYQIQASYDEMKIDVEELSDRSQEIKRQYDQKKMDRITISTMSETLQEHFNQDYLQIDKLNIKIEKKQKDRDELASKLETSEKKYETISQQVESFVYRREELEEQLRTKKNVNSELIEEQKRLEGSLKEALDLQKKTQNSLSEYKLQLERIKIGKDGIKQQAREKYHINLDSHVFDEVEDFDAQKQGKIISSLRTQIQSMGPINMMAVDEYKELSDRHSFMEKQQNEVISSVELLEVAIKEIEEKSKNIFLETFHTLNEEFKNLFPILFPRGEAQITLTNEEDPLESGVEIMVRLPGKNRQSMRLFSGGEKALTAIALIFALLKSKPTPFCFLDEVDAPLDETNVGRYNKVLETLSDRFQFIVITHRRRTMEVFDTLYGVTMQEPGVSKVVGVDMEKSLPAHLQKAFKESKRQGASANP